MSVNFLSLPHSKSLPDIVNPSSSRIGTEYWHGSSEREIKSCNAARCKSEDEANRDKKVINSLLDRDVLSKLSNVEAQRYFRDIRLVVHILREKMVDVNEELKLMVRIRESLERELELLVRDLDVNRDSQKIRSERPRREKLTDGADDLLEAEAVHLISLKGLIQKQLILVRHAVQIMLDAHSRLTNVCKERSLALELVSPVVPVTAYKRNGYVKRFNLPPSSQYRAISSADPSSVNSSSPSFPLDRAGPYTPEVCLALQAAHEALKNCACVRKDAARLLTKSHQVQRSAHESVQRGLYQKLVETGQLKRHLMEATIETQLSLNRAQKFYDSTHNVWCHYKGPQSARDVAVRERLDRPLIKVAQRHHGAVTLRERDEINKSGKELLDILCATGHGIGQLRLTKDELSSDVVDKRAGYSVDKGVAVLRKSNVQLRQSLQPRAEFIIRCSGSTLQ